MRPCMLHAQVKSRQFWGDMVYTHDSDLVAVLMHQGYYAHTLSHPPSSVVEVHVVIKLLPPQEKYPSKLRFVKSRAWGSPTGVCAFQVGGWGWGGAQGEWLSMQVMAGRCAWRAGQGGSGPPHMPSCMHVFMLWAEDA